MYRDVSIIAKGTQMIQQLSAITILAFIACYFAVLMLVSYMTGKNTDSESFFMAGRQSNWVLVAIGMIGASLSGVTFISIPGKVGVEGANQDFSYLQVVMGYMLGYAVVALVLMPLYYRMKLTSIYTYLEERLGYYSYKTGSFYFLVSRMIGSSFRLYLVAIVLQLFAFDAIGIPLAGTVSVILLLIWLYTFRGGLKTIVITDTLQTVSMLLAVFLTIMFISNALETSLISLARDIIKNDMSQIFFFEGGWTDPNNFFKQFISGALITIVMTGLDQDMMQKNLSCPNIRDAQKNMLLFSCILFISNILFLSLGAALYLYVGSVGIEPPDRSDYLYPIVALSHLPAAAGIVFILGLIAAAFSSADSTLTALTTAFCIDFLNFEKRQLSPAEEKSMRTKVHIGFSVLTLIVILIFHAWNDEAVINKLFVAAGYTYGPLLGLFAFGILTPLKVREVLDLTEYSWGSKLPFWLQRINLVVIICLLAPVLSYFIESNSASLLFGFSFGFLIIALNGMITFVGLLLISYKEDLVAEEAHPPYDSGE